MVDGSTLVETEDNKTLHLTVNLFVVNTVSKISSTVVPYLLSIR